jgi:tetratricopeptide (TPR) repeat protein
MNRREKIEERLRSDPDDVFLNYTYAMELSKEDELQAAQKAFARVRQLDPDYIPAYFQEGQMLGKHGEVEAAREILKSGIEVARRIGDSHALGEMTEYLESL